MLAAVISPGLVEVTLVAAAGSKRHPSGADKIRVRLVPGAKSVAAPSLRTMFPSGVKAAPFVEFTALSAEMLFPPVGSITVTLPNSWGVQNAMIQSDRPNRTAMFLMLALEPSWNDQSKLTAALFSHFQCAKFA